VVTIKKEGSKMKKILLSLAVLSSLVMAGENPSETPYNETSSDEECTNEETYVENQSYVNNIIADSTKSTASSTQNMGVGAQFINSKELTILNVPFEMQFDKNIGLEVNIPLINIDTTFSNETGLGDISFGPNYTFGSTSTGLNKTSLIYKTTTGDDNKGLGSGKDAFTLTHKYSQDLDAKYTLNALASYTLNNHTVSGDAYLLMVGASMPCLMSELITTSGKITYFGVADDRYGYGDVTSVDLWLQWDSTKLVKDIPVGFGMKLPIINEKNGLDADKKVLFYLSVASFF